MSTIIPERLTQLTNGAITLDNGNHNDFESGHCAMEVVAWLAGQGHTDAPSCASPVLRRVTISLNDNWDQAQRQKLAPFLPRMVGTADDGLDERRSYLALDWLIRTHTATWLDLAGMTGEAQELRSLRRIMDPVSAQSAGPLVRAAADKAREKRDVAWDAARDAAWAAAGDAARDAAWDALKPTVETLQASALDLLDRMIEPTKEN